jgi:mRNA interferase HigB
MRIISTKFLKEFSKKHAAAESSIKDLIKKIEHAQWNHFSDVRQTCRSADQVTLISLYAGGDELRRRRTKTVVIFNVGGNDYRVVVAINYKTGIVYTIFALTHA